jgi:Tfp pilus assembly protein PilN
MSTVNLLPQDYVQERRQRRPNAITAALFGVVVLAIGFAAVISEQRSRNTRDVCERINTAYADAAKLIDEVHELEAQKRKMLQRARMSADLMERLPRSYILAVLTNALPEGAGLTSIQLEVKAVQPTDQEAPKGPTKHSIVAAGIQMKKKAPAPRLAALLTVKGRAATDVEVARYIARLAKNPLTELVDLSYSKEAQRHTSRQGEEEEEPVREFVLNLRLKPNADALDAINPQAEEPADDTAVADGRTPGGDV